MTVAFVVGTRPDIVKMAPVISLWFEQGRKAVVLHTGQHYSPELSQGFVDEFGIQIDHVLVSRHAGGAAELFGPLVTSTHHWCTNTAPRGAMVVYGDTLSASAAALGAKLAGWKVVHIEAGLRSGNLSMPEEVARMHIDGVSDLLFAPTTIQAKNLSTAGVQGDVFVVGNTIQDALGWKTASKRPKNQAILTLHRRENVEMLPVLMERVQDIVLYFGLGSVIWPMHPTMLKHKDRLAKYPRLKIVEPMGYKAFTEAVRKSTMVFTDSGGLQEECALLGVPCVTLRDTTERPETVQSGWATLMHPSLPTWMTWRSQVDTLLSQVLNRVPPMRYGSDSPSRMIVEIMAQELAFLL